MDNIKQQKLTQDNYQKFQNIIELQQTAIETAHQRTSFLYKVVLIGFFLIILGSVFIAFAMSTQLHRGTDTLKEINTHMSNMSNQIDGMQNSMQTMHGNMSSMVPLIKQIDSMTQIMTRITRDTVAISQSTGEMNLSMQLVSQDMQKMNQSMYQMRGNIKQIETSVYKLSRPMRSFNKMNPFR